MGRLADFLEMAKEAAPRCSDEDITALCRAFEQIGGEELNLPAIMAGLDPDREWMAHELFHDLELHLGLFVVPAGHRIPLHDHPEMTVLLRVVTGQLRIRAYDWAREFPFAGLARPRYDTRLTAASPSCVLRPQQANIHEIEAEQDSAFLDFFTPYYDAQAGRSCRYYDVRESVSRAGEVLVRLEPRV